MRELKRFLCKPHNWVALVLVSLFIFAGLAAPLLAPPLEGEEFSSFQIAPDVKGRVPLPPTLKNPMGTMPALATLGRQYDIYYTVIWGARSALRFGLTTALLTALVGVLVGAVSAHVGGWFNNSIMRLTDAFLAFPLIAGVVIFQQLISMTTPTAENPTGEPNVFTLLFEELDPLVLALILFSWMPHARITNSLVMRLKQADFILASRSLGAGHFRVVFHHLIPNTVSSAVVLAARDIGGMVVLQATLTFIGVVDGSEWGALLAVGRRWIIGAGGNPLQYWWVFIPATLALVLFGVGWNLLGDGLNDWLNPRRH